MSDGRLRGKWLAYAIAIWLGFGAMLFATARPQNITWNIGPGMQIPHVSGELTTNAVHTRLVGITTSEDKFIDFDCWPDGKNRACNIPSILDGSAHRAAMIWYVRRDRGFLEGHSRQLLARLRTADGKIDFDRRSYLQRYRANATTEPDYDHLFYWVFVVGMLILVSATKGLGGASNRGK